MAQLTLASRGNMSSGLPSRNGTVVAGRARSDHLAVIYGSWCPGGGHVAIFTHGSRRDMVARFTAGRGSIVTRRAVGDDSRVIKTGGAPGLCLMAQVALQRCWYVAG